jgi:Tfp pilus assembly protein PilO
MQKSSKSLIALLVGVMILGAAYFAYGQWQKLGDTRATFDVSKETNDKLKKAQADADSFLAKYESNRAQASVANRTLPLGNPDVPTLLDNFSRMVADSGLTMIQMNLIKESVNPEIDTATPGSIKSVDVELSVNGTYETFNDFLLRLQRNLRLSDLVSVNISEQEQDSGGTSGLTFVLKIRTYYQQ